MVVMVSSGTSEASVAAGFAAEGFELPCTAELLFDWPAGFVAAGAEPLCGSAGAGVAAEVPDCVLELDEAGAGGGGAGGGGYFATDGALGSGCGEVWATSPHGSAAAKTRINPYFM